MSSWQIVCAMPTDPVAVAVKAGVIVEPTVELAVGEVIDTVGSVTLSPW